MFSTDSYSTVRGVDKLIPVDVYLPGCPPKPEAVIDALTKLRKKISRVEDRTLSQKINRYGYNYLRSQCAYDVAPGGSLASVYILREYSMV